MNSEIIQTKNLTRSYQSYIKPEGLIESLKGFYNRKHRTITALHPTSLTINKGEIVGLVGANGAGKTTLIKLLSGLVSPSDGNCQVLGHNPSLREPEYLRKMSVLLGQKNQLWWDLTPLDSFGLLIEIYDLDRAEAKRRIYFLAEMLGCHHVLQTQLRRLSLGERMKMEMIGALLHEPSVLFLDEPTIGLDIVAQTNLRHFLADYVKTKSPTVILTSHYMDDIARLSNRLLLLSKGSLVYDGSVDGFLSASESKKKLKFSLLEPLEADLTLMPGQVLLKGEQDFSISILDHEIPKMLEPISKLAGISGIQIEERDFEDVICEFLKKES